VAAQPLARLIVEKRQSGQGEDDPDCTDEGGALLEPEQRHRDRHDGRQRDQRENEIRGTGVDGVEEEHLSARTRKSDQGAEQH